MDLFGDTNLVALDRQALFKALRAKTVAKACVPATTSVVGATPYLDDVLALETVHVVGEYRRVTHELRRRGLLINHKRIARLMKMHELGIKPRRRGSCRP
jgi:prephenate dehydratase